MHTWEPPQLPLIHRWQDWLSRDTLLPRMRVAANITRQVEAVLCVTFKGSACSCPSFSHGFEAFPKPIGSCPSTVSSWFEAGCFETVAFTSLNGFQWLPTGTRPVWACLRMVQARSRLGLAFRGFHGSLKLFEAA